MQPLAESKGKGERINISLPREYKELLVSYSTACHMIPSQVIRKWIDENIRGLQQDYKTK
jgi:hypothetical protein